ncbi:DegT/DnrJ/EryC1/StrS family aminotransferase [Hyphomonas sp. WL0036]|uniref:DegT/DnrJ/EryC1/StrS family aminotransferase n=1 Tax=Hyphomonas sediminis TaxID=2866160 RepID=UPI001C7F45BF|nr:DegT/DnrJ/EryC1/StrS family aminotransferase [Hyphomonas sediminis]MBY9066800.1 DegT/DnrJ/EryC1/StrS family aminotransferase [Hyphomonas sediminis]
MQFIDLQAQRRRIETEINSAVQRVIESGRYVLGPEVGELEKQLAAWCGAKHSVSCANGTDALSLPLMAWEVGPGDAVFCPSFTFVATAQVVPALGATPVFVDIHADTYNMDPASLEAAIARVKAEGKLTPRVVIAVDLFGQPADYPAIKAICDREGLKLIADNAQGYGCTLNGKYSSDWADISTTSFFPAKPLGCYGDGGAMVTNDSRLAELVESLRVYGKVTPTDAAQRNFHHDPKYLSLRIGMNSRLDTIQAAILLEKLKLFAEEIELREKVARRYSEALGGKVLRVPHVIEGGQSVWAQYVIEHKNRDGLQAHLTASGIPSMVYYPVPIHQQDFAARFAPPAGSLPVTETASCHVLALPMHPYLSTEDQDRVIAAVLGFNG